MTIIAIAVRIASKSSRSVTCSWTPAQATPTCLENDRREVGLAELDARQVRCVEGLGPAVVDVRRADQLERPGRAPPLGQVGRLEQAGARVDQRGLAPSACWARASPTAARCRRTCRGRQPFIRDTARSTAPSAFGSSGRNSALNEPGELADGHAVLLGDRACRPTKVACSGCSTGPRAAVPPIGLGRSSTTNRTPASDGGDHAVVHRPDVGVEPGADVLDVEHHRLDAGLGGRSRRSAPASSA